MYLDFDMDYCLLLIPFPGGGIIRKNDVLQSVRPIQPVSPEQEVGKTHFSGKIFHHL